MPRQFGPFTLVIRRVFARRVADNRYNIVIMSSYDNFPEL